MAYYSCSYKGERKEEEKGKEEEEKEREREKEKGSRRGREGERGEGGRRREGGERNQVIWEEMIAHERLMMPVTRSGMKEGLSLRRLMVSTKKAGMLPLDPTIRPMISQ